MKFSLIKQQPSYFFENMHEDLNRFLRDSFGDNDFLSTAKMPQLWRPALEVKENKNDYKIKAELPGLNKEDIQVEIEKNQVSISAETKCEEETSDENVHLSEFRYGKFYRSIPLDNPIEIDKSDAEFKNGILKITLKKAETKENETKKIQVK
ncbi:MAG: Hsp20/alpha crystallin family protein [Candidatus Gastranaerophilales bacterium]|nr:Hsp20/alpha crystallin family protein [Candidatus Gastranaerophilales bacterium]